VRPMRQVLALALAVLGAAPAVALAHAEISPKVSLSHQLQLFSLAVPTEKQNASTTKIVLTVPAGFSIDSFAPSPGWQRTAQQSGSGDSAIVQQVTWSGGHVPTGEDSLFQFLATPQSSTTYRFRVQQTYSDGSIVDWSGGESSDSPAPTLEASGSLGGGGGTSTLSLVALIVGSLGLVAGGFALASRTSSAGGGRPLT
jgi:uncharacterized protein YcnI